MRIENSYKIIPCYTADVSGVCSALYELGGMVVMHDPSGCNSTYNTHDETRWYDQDSLIYITGLTEMDAIMGNDKKVVRDVVDAAKRLSPRFIALCGSPIPYLNGTDYHAIARMIEKETGICTFAVETNGIHDYTKGAGDALRAYAEHVMKPIWDNVLSQNNMYRCSKIAENKNVLNQSFVNENMSQKSMAKSVNKSPVREINTGISTSLSEHNENYQHFSCISDKNNKLVINILGATPLDFAADSSICSLKNALINRDINISIIFSASCADDVDKFGNAVLADANLVVSTAGLPLAELMYTEYGIPYVVGVPIGRFADILCEDIRETAEKRCMAGEQSDSFNGRISYIKRAAWLKTADLRKHDQSNSFAESGSGSGSYAAYDESITNGKTGSGRLPLAVIGEAVTMGSLAAAISIEYGIPVGVLCPLENSDTLLSEGDHHFMGEIQCTELMKHYEHVIADPLYLPVCPPGTTLHRLPHEAFSGRCCRSEMRDIITLLDA